MEKNKKNHSFFKIKEIAENISLILKVGLKVAILLGILIAAIYFMQISFIPIADLTSFIYLLIFIAVTGILVLIFLILPFFIAPSIWLSLLESPKTCKILIGDEGKVSYFKKALKKGVITVSPSEQKWIAGRYLLSTLFWITLTIIIISLISYWPKTWPFKQAWIIAIFIGSLFLFFIINFLITPQNQAKNFSQKFSILKQNFESFTYICFVSFFCTIILLAGNILNIGLLYWQTSEPTLWLLIFLPFLITLASGACLIPTKDFRHGICRWRLAVASFTMIFLFIYYGIGGVMSRGIVKTFKLGSITNATLSLNKIGCETLSKSGFSINCSNGNVYLASGIDILCRVGEYYISFGENENKKYLIVPRKHVLGVTLTTKEKM